MSSNFIIYLLMHKALRVGYEPDFFNEPIESVSQLVKLICYRVVNFALICDK